MNEVHRPHQHRWERSPDDGLVRYVHLMYGLHALAIAVGLLTSATVVGRFMFGLPSIAAVIMNYARRDAARGTYLSSHFRWQLRSFWFAFLALVAAAIVSSPLLLLLGLGLVIWYAAVAAIGLWVIYRIARGWLALRHQRPLPYDPPPITVG